MKNTSVLKKKKKANNILKLIFLNEGKALQDFFQRRTETRWGGMCVSGTGEKLKTAVRSDRVVHPDAPWPTADRSETSERTENGADCLLSDSFSL